MSTDEPDVRSTDFQPGDSLTGSAWPDVLPQALSTAAVVTVAGQVAKAHIEQRGAERTVIEQSGETQRAVIAAEVERKRIRRPQPPVGDGDAA
ncbi:hypothetical protein [Streptomyces sp. NPDC029674]|uniref:hypothetical protein n=1 Tax=Streptomyces sp. NPDC029674 TaxID=3365297 RepID=UPI00384F4A94